MNDYYIKEFDENYLKSKGFTYDNNLSTSDNIVLSRRSTVYKYKTKSVLEVKFVVQENKQVSIDCYLTNTPMPYSAWYVRHYGKNQIVEDIDKFINKECKKLQIRKIKNNVSKV